MSQILKVESNIEAVSAHARKVLLQGGVIAFPTDTFYGLGVDPFNRDAVDQIFAIKGREKKKTSTLINKRKRTVGNTGKRYHSRSLYFDAGILAWPINLAF